jgi:hypothetical protein
MPRLQRTPAGDPRRWNEHGIDRLSPLYRRRWRQYRPVSPIASRTIVAAVMATIVSSLMDG